MCLLESFWIHVRQTVSNQNPGYWRSIRDYHRSLFQRLQGAYFTSAREENSTTREDSVINNNNLEDKRIFLVSKGLQENHIVGLDIEESGTFQAEGRLDDDRVVVHLPPIEPLPVVPSIDEQSINKRLGHNAIDNMGLDLCKIHESCLPIDTKESGSRSGAAGDEESESGVLYTGSADESCSCSDSECEYHDHDDDEGRSRFTIQDLPLEILHQIFSYLSLSELCRHVAPICRRWRHLANDPVHWQRLVIGPSVTSTHLCKCIRRAPLLKSFCLHWRTDLTLAEVNLFCISCPLLRELNLSYCDNINNTVLAIISDHCRNLTNLNLEGCRMVDTSSIHFIVKLEKLTSICLSHCTAVDTEGIEVLSENLSKILKLNIDGIPDITDCAIKNLVAFHGYHLQMLCVDGAVLTDEAFGAISQCRLLKTLCVSFGEILTDYTLASLQSVSTLQTLRLCKCGGFSLEGLINFFSLKTFKNLVHLDLSDCINLHDGGIHSIVQCCGHSLHQLYLCWCWYITDIGLQDIIHNCLNMEVLDLMGLCDIGGNCLVMIPITMPKLRLLDLSQCHQVTDELLVDVVAQLPKLVVFNYYGEKIQYCPYTGRRKHRLHRCTLTNHINQIR